MHNGFIASLGHVIHEKLTYFIRFVKYLTEYFQGMQQNMMCYLWIQGSLLGQVLDFLHELILQGMIYIFSCRGNKNISRLFIIFPIEPRNLNEPVSYSIFI